MGKQLNVENSVISAKDDALFYNAMLQKNGVWQYGNKLEYEIISANQINIKDGMVTAQGRNYVIYPNEVDSMTIENGTVNTKRNDLIVYEISKTSEGEQVGLKVIRGTNAVTPTDPILVQENTLVSGSKYQMPLYRVRLNGINVEGVDDLREYIVSFGNLVNDNLLINSDFRNPINQRGQTSYASVDGSYTCVYSIDRWRLQLGCCLTVNDDSINLTSNRASGTCAFQYVPEFVYEENNYTIQVNVKSLTNNANLTIYGTGAKVVLQKALSVGNNVFSIENSDIMLVQFDITKDTVLEIEYIKLEQGSIATPFVPRPYAEELALCQRYYQTYNGRLLMGIYNKDYADGQYYFPVEMRTDPTVTFISCDYYDNSLGWVVPQSIELSAYHNSKYISCRLQRGSNDTFSLGLTINSRLDITIEAEIY